MKSLRQGGDAVSETVGYARLLAEDCLLSSPNGLEGCGHDRSGTSRGEHSHLVSSRAVAELERLTAAIGPADSRVAARNGNGERLTHPRVADGSPRAPVTGVAPASILLDRIIESHPGLRAELERDGYRLRSDADVEAITSLLERPYVDEQSGVGNGNGNAATHLDPGIAADLPQRRVAHLVEEDEVAMLAVLLRKHAEGRRRQPSARLAQLLARHATPPEHLAPFLHPHHPTAETVPPPGEGSSLAVLEAADGADGSRYRPEGVVYVPRPPASAPRAGTAPARSRQTKPRTADAAPARPRQTKPRAAGAAAASKAKPPAAGAAPASRAKPRAAAAAAASKAKPPAAGAAPASKAKPRAAGAAPASKAKPRAAGAAPASKAKPRAAGATPSPKAKPRAAGAAPAPTTAPRQVPPDKPRTTRARPLPTDKPRQTKPRPLDGAPAHRPVSAGTAVVESPPAPAPREARPKTTAPRTKVAAAPALTPLDESLEAVPVRYRRSLPVRIGIRSLQVVCVLYAAALLWWLWLAKELSVTALFEDPLVYGYSIVITAYILARFALGLLYRPTPDLGHRPSVSIVIPVFNEGEGIHATVEACYEARYPRERLEVVAIDDGSTDDSWEQLLALRRRFPALVCVRFPENRGKRAAMAEGVRRSRGAVCVFVDSDSVIAPNGLEAIVQDFADERVGAVVGHADVLNRENAWIPQMQQVRYYLAFRILKASESLFGAVTCASGCLSAYRRQALAEVLREWEAQTFLGRRATYGDDRALTNRVLVGWRVVYQSRALCHTLVPTDLRLFLRQQLRWKKSWLRESLYLSCIIWRKNPAAAALTYTSIVCGWVAPLIVLRAVVLAPITGSGEPAFYAAGVYSIALLGALYYAVARRSPLWWQGLTWAAVYITLLVWQLYYALATIRNTAWGTRSSTHSEVSGETIVIRPEERAAPSRGPVLVPAVETEGR